MAPDTTIMETNKKLIISIGTNIEQETNMLKAEIMLVKLFGDKILFTDNIWNDPVDIDSDLFLNRLAAVNTPHGLLQLQRAFKQIERHVGASKGEKRRGIVRIDIDILQYDEERLHVEDWNRPYVEKLLKQLDRKKYQK